MKNDGWLGRNYLKGVAGSRLNALLAACGQNLRKLLAWLAAHPRPFFCAWMRLLLGALCSPDRPCRAAGRNLSCSLLHGAC
jgi:IS5 family transposase